MKKYLLMLLIAGGAVLVFIYGAKLFSPGSYVYAEEYELPVDESTLITLINNFIEENPQFKVPVQVGLANGRNGKSDHWYHIYLYYPQENQIIYFWTRPAGKQKTTLALVGIGNGLELGNWKDINKDFSSSENEAQKKKFEERILNKIKEKIMR